MSSPLLELRDVTRTYRAPGTAFGRKRLHALRGVTVTIGEGESVALVGESGCGKTTLARIAVRLESAETGDVLVDGISRRDLSRGQLRLGTTEIQLIPQDASAALDPRMTIAVSIGEPLSIHRRGSKAEREARVLDLLDEVGLDRSLADRFPHQLSGGQRQRVVIARALALEPKLLIADEPVSALDVSVRAQILNLLREIRERRSLALLLISHDLAVVRTISERIDVMYLGRIVESGPTAAVIDQPAHPYTAALVAAFPDPDPTTRERRAAPEGEVPSPVDLPVGCAFAGRCLHVQEDCRATDPHLSDHGVARRVACFHPLV
ncbi:MAG: ABC transporter ATP-binding protein [Thermoleophilia bacterium]